MQTASTVLPIAQFPGAQVNQCQVQTSERKVKTSAIKKPAILRMTGSLSTQSARALDTVVHIELNWVSGVLNVIDLFHFQLDVGIDHIVGENTARSEELAIRIQ